MAVAYHKDYFFISYEVVFKTFCLQKNIYNKHITKPKMVEARISKTIIGKLDKFIVKARLSEFKSFIFQSPLQNNDKLRAFQEAKDKLIELQKAEQEAKDAWLKTEQGARTWFDELFEP